MTAPVAPAVALPEAVEAAVDLLHRRALVAGSVATDIAMIKADATADDLRAAIVAYGRECAAEAGARAERLRLEAQTWAQEARAQRATVREAYRAATGATGEPGDWHGAEPIRAALAVAREAGRAEFVERQLRREGCLCDPCEPSFDEMRCDGCGASLAPPTDVQLRAAYQDGAADARSEFDDACARLHDCDPTTFIVIDRAMIGQPYPRWWCEVMPTRGGAHFVADTPTAAILAAAAALDGEGDDGAR